MNRRMKTEKTEKIIKENVKCFRKAKYVTAKIIMTNKKKEERV